MGEPPAGLQDAYRDAAASGSREGMLCPDWRALGLAELLFSCSAKPFVLNIEH